MSAPRLIHTPLAHYESAYERVSGDYGASVSLLSFLELCQKRWGSDFFGGHWLELGCGCGSTFEGLKADTPSKVTGADFSTRACARAKARALEHLAFEIDFQTAHLEAIWPTSWRPFDGILDAHLLHCLNGKNEILKALGSCYSHLIPGGALVAEVMISSKHFAPDEGLDYDPRSGLLRRPSGPTLHTLLAAYDWEQLILRSGLQIFYFEVYSHLRFIHNPKREHLLATDPEVLRFIAHKPNE